MTYRSLTVLSGILSVPAGREEDGVTGVNGRVRMCIVIYFYFRYLFIFQGKNSRGRSGTPYFTKVFLNAAGSMSLLYGGVPAMTLKLAIHHYH